MKRFRGFSEEWKLNLKFTKQILKRFEWIEIWGFCILSLLLLCSSLLILKKKTFEWPTLTKQISRIFHVTLFYGIFYELCIIFYIWRKNHSKTSLHSLKTVKLLVYSIQNWQNFTYTILRLGPSFFMKKIFLCSKANIL